MAVVQISRIQVRRGKASSGTGMPQLASGELAWAIDNQQLYIGNGSVAEGSPAVGNTKILTENDLSAQGNILNLIQHIYKSNDPSMQTGPTANTPVTRYLQDRLDDRVTTTDFGTIGDGIANDTAAIQRAIDQLFLNPATVGTTNARVILELPAGTFKVTSTIYVPSYVTLVGAGAGSSIIEFTGTGAVFQFINDTSTQSVRSTISSTLVTNQPRHIKMEGFTVHTNTDDQKAFQLDAVADSTFEDIEILGEWGETVDNGSIGIELNAYTSLVTCQRNKFKNITISGFTHGVHSKQDIAHNEFRYCFVNDCYRGFDFGTGSNGSSTGEQTGPVDNTLESCNFENIKRQAVYIERGTGNAVNNCRMEDVGNNGGGHMEIAYPQVYFKQSGNSVIALKSDRQAGLSNQALLVQYVPEATGYVTYTSYGNRTVNLVTVGGFELATRLPMTTDHDGNPIGSIMYTIDYMYRSADLGITRQGVLTLVAEQSSKSVQLTDDYNYIGPETGTEALDLEFAVELLDEAGSPVTSSLLSLPYSIALNYTNPAGGGKFTYSYTAISHTGIIVS